MALGRPKAALVLAGPEREELERLARRATTAQALALRARIVLRCALGASNLAVAMAQAGNRILLLDADFRKPMQHKIFEIASKAGLSSVLAGEAPLDEAIFHSPIAGLDVLPFVLLVAR